MHTHGRIPQRLVLTALLGAAACGTDDRLVLPAPQVLEVPAAAGAALPHVAQDGDHAILSWVEPADSGHALRFARHDGSRWTAPQTVAQGSDWFVNWADFPSVLSLGDGSLAAHWLQRSGAGTYAYDVMVTRSADGGVTWSAPITPHSDGTPTEHGFVTLFPDDHDLGVVWLDGRQFAGEAATNEMALRFSTVGDTEIVLDARVCDCCQTAVALTARGPLVAYRDRSPTEIRDIAIIRRVDGSWTEPVTLHADGWQIDACPVNGPQADARGSDVIVAWFTAANDQPLVRIAFSGDAGETFSEPVRVDAGNPLGRVDVLLLDAGRALVVWLERTADDGSVLARLVSSDGTMGEPVSLAATAAQRTSGFPRMARQNGGVLVAWTEPGDTSRVRAALIPVH